MTSEVWAPKPSKCHAVVIYCVNRPFELAHIFKRHAHGEGAAQEHSANRLWN
jgi:hypothetical protein